MGQRHLTKIYKNLVSEAGGRYAVLRDLRYEEDKKNDQKFILVDKRSGDEKAKMVVRSLPGCCGVLLLHTFSGGAKDIASFVGMAARAGEKSGYGQLLLTLRSESKVIPLLREEYSEDGELCEYDFVNGKTGNQVTTVVLGLEPKTKEVKDSEGE